MTKYTVVVAGNIGVGKSSLSAILGDALGWQVFYEAVDDNPYLSDFYDDMGRWSFHSQIYFLARRLCDHHQMVRHPHTVVQDRSIYEDAEVFARNLYRQGYMSDRDYASYRQLYTALCEVLPPPTLIVFLRASVPTLLERIRMRGREFEQSIDPAYLELLNHLYGEWIGAFQQCPVLTLDADALDFVHRDEHRQQVIARIQTALEQMPSQA